MPHVEGVEHRFLDLNGVSIHVAEAGPPDAQPVLLLHGWPQHWYLWRDVVPGLKDHFRLLMPDLRGFGWSDPPGHGYDTDTFAADQLALLEALGIERAHLVGHDWGGWTSFRLALTQPDRFERMLILNSPHPWPRIRPRLVRQGWRSWYTIPNAMPGLGSFLHRRGRWVRAVLSRGSPAGTFTDAELDEFASQFHDPSRAAAASRLYRHYLSMFLSIPRGGSGPPPPLTVPTLLLFGERDLLVTRELVRGFEATATDGRLELAPDTGHFIVDEKPALVVERAREQFA
jgi:pimeloyl-ACP methyl ester carboxylesterase